MPKNPKLSNLQTDFFDQIDRLQPGEKLPVPISTREIGGELLNILSKGLYTNPLDAIREYVQNSIDAGADEVTIHVTGNTVNILDRGSGMDLKTLLQAREFGVSKKSMEENVGFRGIGLYSGFDLCERLTIRTKTSDSTVVNVLEFNFKAMRDVLEEARKDKERPTIPLADLLGKYTRIYAPEPTEDEGSFTIVQLQELSEDHIHRLSDVNEVKNYILRNLPIKFSDGFNYGEEIEKALVKNVKGYKSSRVILKIDNSELVIVEKPNIPDLEHPRMGFIYSKGTAVAYYWACLTQTNNKIKDHYGFVYKVKGFTIGTNEYLRKYHPRIYEWWTGEIYVIDTNVIPTSARDDFEANRAKQELEKAIGDVFKGDDKTSLQRVALDTQQKRRADDVVNGCIERLSKAQTKFDSGDYDQFSLYEELGDIVRILKNQVKKASNTVNAEKINKQAKSLQQSVKKQIENPNPIPLADRKKEATKIALEQAETKKAEEIEETEDKSKKDEERQEETSKNQSVSQEPGKLVAVIEKAGWSIDDSCLELITLLDDSIIDVLGPDNILYNNLLMVVEEKIGEILEEE